jgi:hypothetical protein
MLFKDSLQQTNPRPIREHIINICELILLCSMQLQLTCIQIWCASF